MVVLLSPPSPKLLFRPGWMAGLVGLGWLLLAPCIQLVYAQASGHQRLGVEPQVQWEAELEWTVSLGPVGYTGYSLPDLDSSFSLGLQSGRKWSAGLVVPVRFSRLPDGYASGLFILGDATASVGWTHIRGDTRIRGGLNLRVPSGDWHGYQEVPGTVAGGAGRWTIGLWGGLFSIIDPLVLGGMLSWNLGLPRTERWGRLWRPGDFSLALSVTEVFNEFVSCTAVLSQYVSFPESSWGTRLQRPDDEAPGYNAMIGIKLLMSGRSFNGGVGVSRSLVHDSDPGSVDFSVAYILRKKEGP